MQPRDVAAINTAALSPVSIQTQSLALRALRKRKPQETQALALASSQSCLPLLRPSIPIGWRLRLLREIFTQQTQAVANMIGCLPTQALAFLAVFVYATHATQAIAFEWKPGLMHPFYFERKTFPVLAQNNLMSLVII